MTDRPDFKNFVGNRRVLQHGLSGSAWVDFYTGLVEKKAIAFQRHWLFSGMNHKTGD